jgi:hypothetical protein
MSGPRCLFCSSSSGLGKWVVKGTGLPCCDRCAPVKKDYLEPAEKIVKGKKCEAVR